METNTPVTSHHSAPASELNKLVRLALPILTAQLAQMAMVLVDTLMAGRVSAVDLAGVALGGALMWPMMMFFMGVLQAVTPAVSQLNGAGRQREVGEVIRQALWLAGLAQVCSLHLSLTPRSSMPLW